MQNRSEHVAYIIRVTQGGESKYFSSSERVDSCSITPYIQVARRFGTRCSAAATVRWCTALQSANPEVIEFSPNKEPNKNFRQTLVAEAPRVNARAFREDLAKQIEISNRYRTPVVLTRHGKDSAALISADDVWKLNILKAILREKIGSEQALADAADLYEAATIIRSCAESFLKRTYNTHISELEDYCANLLLSETSKSRDHPIPVKQAVFCGWYIVRQIESKGKSRLTRERLQKIVEAQLSSGKVNEIIKMSARHAF